MEAHSTRSILVSRNGTKRFSSICLAFSLVMILVFILSTTGTNITRSTAHSSWARLGNYGAVSAPTERPLLPTTSKYAYATFLTNDSEHAPGGDRDSDHYFVSARMLTYQLRYAPETRSEVPLVVLVTPEVSHDKRQQLISDGALVWEAAPVESGLVHTDAYNWQDVMTKLRLWELTQFERIVFMDADTILFRPISGIFEDTAVIPQSVEVNEGVALPSQYVFAANRETQFSHHWPPIEEHVDFPNIDYLNAGLLVIQPDSQLFEYYLSLTRIPELFDAHFPEQGLLNHAHRREGDMPWKQLDIKWGIHYPTLQDIEGGVHLVHEKFWDPFHRDVAPLLLAVRWRMEGFYQARNLSCT